MTAVDVKCRIRQSGLGYLVELHVEVDKNISVRQGMISPTGSKIPCSIPIYIF